MEVASTALQGGRSRRPITGPLHAILDLAIRTGSSSQPAAVERAHFGRGCSSADRATRGSDVSDSDPEPRHGPIALYPPACRLRSASGLGGRSARGGDPGFSEIV